VPKCLNAVNRDYRNIVFVFLEEQRVSFDIDLFEREIAGTVCGEHHLLCHFAKMAAGLRVNSDSGIRHWETFSVSD
jgi:hypothetical protein